MCDPRSSIDWPAVITDAYAAEARPPLTEHLREEIRTALAEALAPQAGEETANVVQRANEALDAFEVRLRSVVGPRVDRIDEQAGAVAMKHRSEADHPLRAFGGQ